MPILWSYTPDIAIVAYTSDVPQHDMGSYLSPCIGLAK